MNTFRLQSPMSRFTLSTARPRNLRYLVSAALLSLLVLTVSPAYAQKSSKPGRGAQGGNRTPGGVKEDSRDSRDYELAALLPNGYRHLRTEEVRQLELLVRNTLAWIRRTAAPGSGFQSSVDLFQPSADTSDSPSAEVRGLWILSILNLEQRKTLAAVLDEYRRLSASRNQAATQLTELLEAVHSQESPLHLRKLEVDSRRPLHEIAGIDTELGTLQARVFLRIARSLDNQQSERILLAIRSPDVSGDATLEMQSVQTELRNTSADAARDLQQLGLSFAAWLATPDAGGAGRQPPAADVRRRGGSGRDRVVDSVVIEFLAALHGQQQDLLLQLLATSARRHGEAAAATAALQTALRPGQGGRIADERVIRGLAQRRAQAAFFAAADDATGFEALSRTLSAAQKKHLSIHDNDNPEKPKPGGDYK